MFKVSGQLVPKLEWKQTDGQTDAGDCITCRINAIGNNTPNSTSLTLQLSMPMAIYFYCSVSFMRFLCIINSKLTHTRRLQQFIQMTIACLEPVCLSTINRLRVIIG